MTTITLTAEQTEDTQLIQAAPSLLAALSALLEWGRDNTSPRDVNSPHLLLVAADVAIAMAEGRPDPFEAGFGGSNDTLQD